MLIKLNHVRILLVVGLFASISIHISVTAGILSNEEDVGDYLGDSEIEIEMPVPGSARSSSSEQPKQPPPLLVIKATIPNSSYQIRCELFRNRLLFPANFQVDFVGIAPEPSSETEANETQAHSCHYVGLASVDSFIFRTKCVFSLCHRLRTGIVWLPGDDTQLVFSSPIGDDESYHRIVAKIFARGNMAGTKSMSELFEKQSARSRTLAPKMVEDLKWTKQLLQDSVPSNWHHLRVAALVTAESFGSPVLKNDAKLTVDTISSVFNYVNVIWWQLNVSVHLTRLTVWGNDIPANEVEAMPDEDWDEAVSLIMPRLKVTAERKLWPKLSDVDYIVVIRNMVTKEAKSGDSPIGLTYAGTVCKGVAMESAGKGSVLAVRTRALTNIAEAIVALTTTVAHELGHAFGVFDHDEPHCKCPSRDRNCLMVNKVDRSFFRLIQWGWSDCSVEIIRRYLEMLPPLCLKQMPNLPEISGSTAPVCGNGIIEPGEECDCGPGKSFGKPHQDFSTVFCQNTKCCNFRTCKLVKGAKCASGPCCNSDTCLFYDNETLCREPRSQCDLMETCTGSSSLCPADRFLMTGTPCDELEGTCYEGKCVSRNNYCSEVMGGHHQPMSTASKCYANNERGLKTANCGHTFFRTMFWSGRSDMTPCTSRNRECGNIMCQSGDFTSSKSVLAGSFDYDKTMLAGVVCLSVAGEMLPDFGHTPDGVLCANGLGYCLGQRCVTPLPSCSESAPCDNFGRHVNREANNGTAATNVRAILSRKKSRPAFFSSSISEASLHRSKHRTFAIEISCLLLLIATLFT